MSMTIVCIYERKTCECDIGLTRRGGRKRFSRKHRQQTKRHFRAQKHSLLPFMRPNRRGSLVLEGEGRGKYSNKEHYTVFELTPPFFYVLEIFFVVVLTLVLIKLNPRVWSTHSTKSLILS